MPRKNTNPPSLFSLRSTKNIFFIGFLCWVQFSFGQPSNDNSATPIVITSLINSCSSDAAYTTLNATADLNAGSCWADGPNANVWFSFVATATGTIQVNLDRGNIAGSMKGDMRYAYMALWDATGTTEIACGSYIDVSDDISMLATGLIDGNTYLISVDRRYPTPLSAESFTLCLSDSPTNDYLEGATNIDAFMNGCSADADFTTLGATADRNPASCWPTVVGPGPHRNVWFEVTAPPTGTIEVKLDTGGAKGVLQTSMLALWDSSGNEVSCNSYRIGNDYDDVSLLATGLASGTYYISVDNIYIHAPDTFTLCLSDAPTNDYFEGATDVTGLIGTCSGNEAFTTLGNTFDRNTGTCWPAIVNHNTWFRFEAPPSGRIQIDLDSGAPQGTLRHAYMALWSTDGTTELGCATYSDPDDDLRLRHWSLTPGTTYYISVDNRYITTTDTFALCLDALNGPDTDGDGVGDAVDLDDDNDGIYDRMEACEHTDLSGTVGIGNAITDTTYPIAGTDVTYEVIQTPGTSIYAYNTGLNGLGIRIDGQAGETGSLTSTYSTPIENVFFKMTDFDNETQITVEVYDQSNVLYDLDSEGIVSLGSGITQAGNNFSAGTFDSDGDDPADDATGAIYFYFEQPVSRVVLTYNHVVNSSTRFIQPTYCNADFDNDGIKNHKDLDSDNDGIPDNIEGQTTIGYTISNADDAPTYRSNNGVNSAYLGGNTPPDTDGTEQNDVLDIDSDGDGIIDTSEANITLTMADADSDGLDDATDATPDYSDVGGTIDNPLAAPIVLPDVDNDASSGGDVDYRDAVDDSIDADNDGVADAIDLDDDNDGILDSEENSCANISTGQNISSNLGALQNANTDLAANIKYVFDIESVSASGILTGVAVDGPFLGQLINIYMTNTTQGGATLNGITAVYNSDFTYDASASSSTGGLVNSGFYIFYGIIDANSNGTYEDGVDELLGPVDPLVANSMAVSTLTGPLYFYFNDGIYGDNLASIDFGIKEENCDTDGDGIANIFDLDTDNDGILDIAEAGHGQVDADNNGRIDGLPTAFGANGLFNGIESDDTQVATVTYAIAESLDDSDAIANYLDLDSDGDGIPDNVEAQTTTAYAAPNADNAATYLTNNGVNSAYLGGLTPTNTDTTDLPDYLDIDSDNEGANDTSEAVITLTGNDVDTDGLDDATDADTSGYLDPGGTIDDPLFGAIQLPDTDEDATLGGDVDFRDATDDRPDTDNDGIVDAEDLDDDNDGILDSDELNVVISNAQPDCTNETIMDFSTAPTLESGPALQQGAVYRFPNVTAGTDALVTIYMTFNAFVSDIDNNSAEAQAFRPRTGFDISNVGKEGYIEYRMQFVNSGGSTPVVIDKFFMNINDTDGNVDYSEEIWVNSPTSYIISNPTELTIDYNNPWVIASGGTTEYPGAGNTFPQVNFGINYISRSEISFRAGITTIVPTVAASGREHNIDFRCTTNYINPITYGLDIDGDGINNNLDSDSDGDGCNDADEAYGDSNTDSDDNGMFGTGIPTVNSDGTVTGASYQVPADGDTNGTPDFLEVGAVPVITTQPLDAAICEGENLTFVVASDANSYQWQINNGSGWLDLADSGIHGGTNTDTLTITNVQLADSGAQYQVILTNSGYACGTSTSNPVGLIVSSVPDITIGDASEIEGGSIIFPLTLSSASCGNEDIILTLSFSDGTADATDYLSTPVQITIPSGVTSAEVIVPTTEDTINEEDETFTIAIASVDAGTVNDTTNTAIGTILDDETTDLDSDDDGILDSMEDSNADGDNDPSTNPRDSDSDSYPDYLDIDSDNDGIPDNVEAQTTSGYTAPSLIDANGNGLDDAYENGTNIGLSPVNTDGADAPDYLDHDSDNDNIPDSIEGHDQDHDGVPNVTLVGSDKDDDGLDDSYEGSQQIDVDVNDEIDDPISTLPNTDDDGEPDYRDSDDDGDGIDTIDEDANNDGDYANDDIDNDGIPDYLEPNWPDVEVFNAVTPNGDGVHDILTITGLDIRPNNTLQIFNRWGIVVFSTDGYDDTSNYFDGTSQARATLGEDKKLPVGTYFYILDYEDVDGVGKQLSGYMYLN